MTIAQAIFAWLILDEIAVILLIERAIARGKFQ